MGCTGTDIAGYGGVSLAGRESDAMHGESRHSAGATISGDEKAPSMSPSPPQSTALGCPASCGGALDPVKIIASSSRHSGSVSH